MFNSKKYLPFLLVAIIFISCAGYSNSQKTEVKMENISITVRSGDTVWGLAEQFKGEQEDIREVVARIYNFNSLTGKVIKAGDSLIIPVSQKVRTEMLAKANN